MNFNSSYGTSRALNTFCLLASVNFFESQTPALSNELNVSIHDLSILEITVHETTGPASGPRPTSSVARHKDACGNNPLQTFDQKTLNSKVTYDRNQLQYVLTYLNDLLDNKV